jgi:putative NADH-flavin reductase
MKVLVLGTTGGTGRLIVHDALKKGHSLVALVRSKARGCRTVTPHCF